MSSRKSVGLLVLPLTIVLSCRLAWREYTAPDGTFSVSFPGSPTVEFETSGADGDRAMRGLLQVEERWTLDGYRRYRLFFEDRDALLRPDDALINALQTFVEGYSSDAQAKAVNEKEIEIDGYPGIEFTLEIADMPVSRVRLYAIGERVFQLSVYGAIEDGSIVQRFFNSFRILRDE